MDHQDRFFTIVCTSALLLTVGAFVGSHMGSWKTSATPAATGPHRAGIPAEALDQEEPGDSGAQDLALACTEAATPVGVRMESATAVVAHAVDKDGWRPMDQQSLRRLAGALEAVASGVTPSVDGFDLPSMRDVLVRRDRDGLLVVAAGTQRRYGPVVEALASIDPEAAVQWFRREGAAFGQVAGAGSKGDGSFELLLREAVEHVLVVDLPEEPVVLVSRGARWGFVDADIETLSPVQKHLLLMGRKDARRFQSSLRELQESFGWSRSPRVVGRVAELGDDRRDLREDGAGGTPASSEGVRPAEAAAQP